MIGRIGCSACRGRTEIETKTIGLLTVLDVVMHEPPGQPIWMGQRRIRKLERLLRRWGIKRLILDSSFSHPERLSGWNMVDVLPFYRSIADLIALEYIRCKGVSHNRAVVALSASRVCPELRGTAERLSTMVRGIAIDVPEEGARYAAWLHRQFGLPIRTMEDADVTVAFSTTVGDEEDVISLCEGKLELGGVCVTAPELVLPEGSGPALLAALWECGSLDRKSLKLEVRKTS